MGSKSSIKTTGGAGRAALTETVDPIGVSCAVPVYAGY